MSKEWLGPMARLVTSVTVGLAVVACDGRTKVSLTATPEPGQPAESGCVNAGKIGGAARDCEEQASISTPAATCAGKIGGPSRDCESK